jgi:large repetitive protein
VARVRVGAAELVDSRGRRWPVAAERTAGGIRWRVAEATLAEATFPVALDPFIGAEFALDTPVPVPALGDQQDTVVASNGFGYLVVWEDDRDGAANSDIRGTLVDTSGTVLNVSGLDISTAANAQRWPAVASNGVDYLVTWQDTRVPTDPQIYGSRVASFGFIYDPDGIAITSAPAAPAQPAVASNGTDYFVTWADNRNLATTSSDIYGARVDMLAGTVLDPSGLPISTAVGVQNAAAIAWNGSFYLAAWEDSRSGTGETEVYATRLGSDGSVIDGSGFVVATSGMNQILPAVASNGTDFLVTWQHHSSATSVEIHAGRVSSMGVALDPTDIIIVPDAPGTVLMPSVASDGTDYFVTWSLTPGPGSPFDAYGGRVTAAGVVLDPGGIYIASTDAGSNRLTAVASDGTGYLVTWQNVSSAASAGLDVSGMRISSAGVLLDSAPIVLASDQNQEARPAVASNGTDYLVVWTDDRASDGGDIYGSRVDSTGLSLDPNGLQIAVAPGAQQDPAVASDGSSYMVVWSDARTDTAGDISGTRVHPTGTLLDSGLAISTAPFGQTSPAIAASATGYFVAWTDARGANIDIYGSRLSSSGSVLDAAGLPVTTAGGDQGHPAVASDGTDYYVAWEDLRSGPTHDIYGGRVAAADGAAPDGNGVPIAAATREQVFPTIASNGTVYLVAWQDSRSGVDDDIYGARLDATGAVLGGTDPIAISHPAASQRRPAVGSNGSDFLVAWQDDRNGVDDIFGTRVTGGGLVMDPGGIGISADFSHGTAPRVAYGLAQDNYIVTYETNGRVAARLIYRECGDGTIDGNETCDDRNPNPGDGCDATCNIEPGFTCSNTPSICRDIDECADGTLTCGENATCDNTPGSAACTCDEGYHGDGQTCETLCGDGIQNGAEACDDGNTADLDGCSATCVVEPPLPPEESGCGCVAAAPGGGAPAGSILALGVLALALRLTRRKHRV